MKNKKLAYVAGKIGDLEIAIYMRNFEQASKEIESLGFQAVDPTELPHMHDKSWLSHMREDIRAMMRCNVVYAQTNWRDSKGATIEVTLALQLGIPVIYQNAFEAFKASAMDITQLSKEQINDIQSIERHINSSGKIYESQSLTEKLTHKSMEDIFPITSKEAFHEKDKPFPGIPNIEEKYGPYKAGIDPIRTSIISLGGYSYAEEWETVDREWRDYPLGTIAQALMGGHWFRVKLGWKWNGPDGSGGVFPTPGADNSGRVKRPKCEQCEGSGEYDGATCMRCIGTGNF